MAKRWKVLCRVALPSWLETGGLAGRHQHQSYELVVYGVSEHKMEIAFIAVHYYRNYGARITTAPYYYPKQAP